MLLIVILLIAIQENVSANLETVSNIPLMITGIQPRKNDAYLCLAFKLKPDVDHHWIVEIKSLTENGSAHHMDLFTCIEPGYLAKYPDLEHSNEVVWDCGIEVDSGIPEIPKARRCEHSGDFLAPFEFDQKEMSDSYGIGFKVGPNTPFKYLVVEAHYADFRDVQVTSKAGFNVKILRSDNSSRLKDAGLLLLGSVVGSLPRQSMAYLDSACRYPHPQALNFIRYRSHTHHLGELASGFKITGGTNDWQLLGKQIPRHTYHYYPLGNDGSQKQIARLEKGDIVAARCIFRNTRTIDVKIGEGDQDEMCFFYLIYFVDANQSRPLWSCLTETGDYSWENDTILTNVFQQIDETSKSP